MFDNAKIAAAFKRKLRSRQKLVGTWITLDDPAVVEILSEIPFDFFVVDMEHSSLGLNQAAGLIRAIERHRRCALVRVNENHPPLLKRVMDLGPSGVIIPLICSREEAEKAVRSVYYPPRGFRGVGLARAQGYGLRFEEYKVHLSKNISVLGLIEHIDAIENLEEILAVEGLDGTLIGPYDLSGSMGHPGEFYRTDVKQAIHRYEAVASKMRKPLGFHVVHPEPKVAREYFKKGYSLIALGIDSLYLGLKAKEVFEGLDHDF